MATDNQSPHYSNAYGNFKEVWDEMLCMFGIENHITHLEQSAYEYRRRAGYKDDAVRDIEKAIIIEKRIKELKETKEMADKAVEKETEKSTLLRDTYDDFAEYIRRQTESQ